MSGTDCHRQVEILGAQAIYEAEREGDAAPSRQVTLRVEVRSTATTAVSRLDLAVFLGSSMERIEATRLAGLPSQEPRRLEDGGLAFRASVPALVRGANPSVLRVVKRGLPIQKELSGVVVKVVSCQKMQAVGSVQLAPGPGREETGLSGVAILSTGMLVLLFMTVLLLRLR